MKYMEPQKFISSKYREKWIREPITLNYDKLHLGCGTNVKEGYVNLDVIRNRGVDIIHDLDVIPYPFKDNSFKEIIAESVLEHVFDFQATVDEMSRISKDNCLWYIRMPFYHSQTYGADPTHRRACTKDTFKPWTKETTHPYTNQNYRLEIISIKENVAPLGRIIPRIIRNFTALVFGEIIESLTFTIRVKK